MGDAGKPHAELEAADTFLGLTASRASLIVATLAVFAAASAAGALALSLFSYRAQVRASCHRQKTERGYTQTNREEIRALARVALLVVRDTLVADLAAGNAKAVVNDQLFVTVFQKSIVAPTIPGVVCR